MIKGGGNSMAERESIALSVPRSPLSLTMEMQILWNGILTEETGRLVENVYSQEEEQGYVRPQDLETLKRVGALVVACYNTEIIPLDEGVVMHMEEAHRNGKPVFIQIRPYEVTADEPLKQRLEAIEVVHMGSRLELINESLED